MHAANRYLVCIVTESSLESRLSKEIDKMGVHGYTITDARGKGDRGSRRASWDVEGNIKIDVICSESTADELLQHLQNNYYNDFAMITYSHRVFVLRPDKFK